jgi:hypothetical protein
LAQTVTYQPLRHDDEDRNGRLNGGGVGGVGVAEAKQEQQLVLVAKDAAHQTRERIIERI